MSNGDETMLIALQRALSAHPDRKPAAAGIYATGFTDGWLARATEPGMVLVTREYLALLEERARLWVRAGGR